MAASYDPRRSLTALEPDSTLIAVVEMSQSSWLVAAIVPGLERQPLKKLEPDEAALLRLLERWRGEATKVGRTITRVAVAFEAGRDGFWLARWLRAQGIEAHVIYPASIAVSREHRRAKTDRLERLDELRTPEGEALPPNTAAELRRDMVRLRFITDQIKEIEDARAERPERASGEGGNARDRVAGIEGSNAGGPIPLGFRRCVQRSGVLAPACG